MTSPKKPDTDSKKKTDRKLFNPPEGTKDGEQHLGSSNAFQETEDPGSRDPDDITDEKLDELLDE